MEADTESMATEQYDSEQNGSTDTAASEMTELITRLAVSDDVANLAIELYNQFHNHKPEAIASNTELAWFTCFLYVASVEQRSLPYGVGDPQIALGNLPPPCITVTELLTEAHSNMLEFFKLLKTIKECMTLSAKVLQSIHQLERKYLIVCPLFNKFEKIFAEIFLKDETFTQAESLFNADSEGYLFRRSFCWALFVHAKALIVPSNQHLFSMFHLLLSCIDYILRTTPAFQLKPPFDGLKMDSSEDSDGGGSVVLEELCNKYSASIEEVLELRDNLLNPLLNNLAEQGNTIACEDVEKQYTRQYSQFGDINELGFLRNSPHLVVAASTTPEPNNNSLVNGAGGVMGPPMTPVRAVMVTVQSLRNLLNSCTDEPSPSLVTYYKNCARDPQPGIESMLQTLRTTFCEKYSQDRQNANTAQQRYMLATRLFYRVLQSLLKLEEKRLSQQDFSKLLHNIVFQKCLLGCSLEVVIQTYTSTLSPAIHSPNVSTATGEGDGNPDMRFPWILTVFNLHAYDFVKVLESFVKAEPRLPMEVVKHLQHIENRIVESMAWESNSPLYSSLSHSEPPPMSRDSPSDSTALRLCLSPMPPPRSPANHGAALIPPRSPANHGSALIPPHLSSPRSGSCTVRRSHSLNMFFNKVCRLAYHRLQNMCSQLEISRDVQHRVWTCLEYCIAKKTELMRNRHLDQVIMCSIFAVCKISDLDVKFKTIVRMYKSLPHSRQEVYKCVLVGSEYNTIIHFYNMVYMHSLKNFLMQFTTNRPSTLTLSPIPRSNQSLTASPVYTLPGHPNFLVSPLKRSPAPFRPPPSPSQMTPRSKRLYSFGETIGSAEKLKTINDSMKAITNMPGGGPARGGKRLKFDLEAAAEAGVAENSSDGPAVKMIEVRRVSSSPSTAAPPSRKSLNFTNTAQRENKEAGK